MFMCKTLTNCMLFSCLWEVEASQADYGGCELLKLNIPPNAMRRRILGTRQRFFSTCWLQSSPIKMLIKSGSRKIFKNSTFNIWREYKNLSTFVPALVF